MKKMLVVGFLLASTLSFCFVTFAFGATLLPSEAQALLEIGKTLGKTDWDFSVDPCSYQSVWANRTETNNLTCDCSNETVCHVVSMCRSMTLRSSVQDPPYALRSLKTSSQPRSATKSRYTLRSSVTTRSSTSQSLRPIKSISKMYTPAMPRRSPRKNPTSAPACNNRRSKEGVWPPNNEETLLYILLDQVRKGIVPPFGNCIHDIRLELNKLLGKEVYTSDQVQTKITRLKSRYMDFHTLLGNTISTGFGWDPMTNTVSGPEHEWERLKSAYGPKKYFRFKKNPPKHYDLLSTIFEGTYATGAFGFASTQDVPESDSEQPELDLNSPPATTDCTGHEDHRRDNSIGKGKRRASSRESGRSSKRSSQQEEFLQKLEDGWTKRVEGFNQAMDKFTHSSSSHAATSHARGIKSTVEQALDIINELASELSLSDDKYYRALSFATHTNQALMIVKMDPERRRRWLLTII